MATGAFCALFSSHTAREAELGLARATSGVCRTLLRCVRPLALDLLPFASRLWEEGGRSGERLVVAATRTRHIVRPYGRRSAQHAPQILQGRGNVLVGSRECYTPPAPLVMYHRPHDPAPLACATHMRLPAAQATSHVPSTTAATHTREADGAACKISRASSSMRSARGAHRSHRSHTCGGRKPWPRSGASGATALLCDTSRAVPVRTWGLVHRRRPLPTAPPALEPERSTVAPRAHLEPATTPANTRRRHVGETSGSGPRCAPKGTGGGGNPGCI
jgi:hypothetical protein